ncbi:F-box protein At2g27310 isoform X2 [Cryptomeria japonica]|uniref:F-box protein At2g27310 isoform X2 n=1 Tax=Cryptomeria japonica TaxID=3369 RepID=UPI0027DA98C2|nr:F-box protein At2g27310 isoform X2 [Cryptomeria japonica]
MMSLNGDLIADLLGRVDGVTLASLGCVSSQFWSIAKEEKIWEEKCSSLWPSTQDSDVKKFISSSLGGFRNFYASCFPIIAYDESFKRHKVKKTSGDGLPKIDTIENVKKDLNFWGQMTENIRLSWIMVNKRTGQAANLSSWRPLCEQSDWASHKDCVISFGSILPAHNVLPCKSVQCILVLKCRLSDSLKITELSMRLEDTMGAWVNGRDSLLILERAVGCRRSNKQIQFFASYQKHLSERGKLKEANMKNEGCLDIICILGGIVVSASFWCLVFRESGPILEI